MIIHNAKGEDFSAKMRVYDVRDPSAAEDGIQIIGGFVGELIITFTCLLDFVLASPQNQNFSFSAEAVEAYLTDLLTSEELAFPEGVCSLKINKKSEELLEGASPENVAKTVRETGVSADFGLRYLLEV
jgi:hypothetical protein